MKSHVIKLVFSFFIITALFFASHSSVSAYAPNVNGSVMQNTGAPITNIWVEWSSQETGDDDNEENRGTSVRYSGTNEQGKFLFKGWDSEGTFKQNNISYSNVGKREYEQKINLDYDTGNGDEARRASTNKYNIFNCNNEVNTFSLKLPEEMANVRVKARWRRDSNNTAWSNWADNRVSLPKEIFNNSHDYEIQFQIELPKNASIRDLEKDIPATAIGNLKTTVSKIPACVQVDLCTAENKSLCTNYTPAEGKHRVILSRVGDSGIGEARRKLTSNNSPLWLVECIQEGTPAAPSYTCTTGNSNIDRKVFGVDNASALAGKYGYAAKIFTTDGDQTTAEITDSNKQDAYEWETTLNPQIARDRKVNSVFLAMYEDSGTAPPQSGPQNTQKQATLSNSEGCRLVIDPYGKAFDSYTLEPLNGTSITLLKQRSGKQFTKVEANEVVGTLINPQTTSTNGNYSFIVPNGIYRLDASKAGYTFPATDIHANASQFYSNIYKGADIAVKDNPVLANIALEPQNKNQALAYAKSNPITIESYFQSIDKATNTHKIDGYVSHPRATVELYGQKIDADNPHDFRRTKKLGTTEADQDGHFTLSISLNNLEQDEIVGELEATKKKVSGIDIVQSKTAVLALSPMLDSLNGFATAQTGAVIPGAEVEVKLLTGGMTVAATQADDKGFFSIPSESMPSLPYAIVVKSGGTENTLNTNTYLANNARLSGNNNVYYASAGSNVLGEYEKSISDTVDVDVPGDRNMIPPLTSDGAPRGGLMMVAVILIIFIFSATALLTVYISHESKRKKRRR